MPRVAKTAARPVTFSNPGKEYFPSGYTKGEMIRYYLDVAPHILPHLRNRPVTLIRFPEGVKGESFYEKNAPKHAPAWVETGKVPRRHHEGFINYILINNAETLAWCANLGAIELHPFLHCFPKIDTPTHVAFDLDPGEGADIFTCIEVALLLQDVFVSLGLESFPKVSGSKGIQIYVPLNTDATYEVTQPFAKSVAELLERQHPRLVVSAMSKALRRKKVMIDWSQNNQSKTTVCVYSMRGKRDEPFVSMPLTWKEIARARSTRDRAALDFTPVEALRRLKKTGDLFAPVLTLKQRLPKAFLELATYPPQAIRRRASSSRDKNALARYAAKRDFNRTGEPRGQVETAREAEGARRFVIQKHAASRLHYDFRLEMDGTLKSWAVPKGPPYELGVKRAAFEVEDHPIEYMNFEGTIPKGQYGGGTVMVWDTGTYELLGGSHEKGDLKLKLHGRKLKGEWHIFRIKSDESKPMWLLAKSKIAARPVSSRSDDRSVLTQRSMARIAADNDAQWESDRREDGEKSATSPATRRRGKTRPPRRTKRRVVARQR
jgi:bifunctional non-homologous end joining protein LigD